MIRKLVRLAIGPAMGLAVLVALVGCDQKENKFVPPPPPPVTVSHPVRQPVTDYLHLTGNIQAMDQAQLAARVEGILKSIHFRDGDFVSEGDLLFLIEQDVYRARVQQAEGRLAAARAQLLRANQEYDRQLNLLKQNATAKSDVERWKAERDSAQAGIVEAEANLTLAKINLGYTRVVAPFDGRVDRHLVSPGNLVGAGKPTALVDITRMDPVYAYFTLNERDLVRLMRERMANGRNNQADTATEVSAGIQGEEGYPYEGLFDFVSTSLDPDTGTILMRAIFKNPRKASGLPALVPGMFVRLRIPVGRRENALLVPEQALGVDQAGRYLLVVDQQGTVQQRQVKAGALVNGLRVVEEGLNADDRVVVRGIQRARPGGKVTPVAEGAVPAASASNPQ